jgi:hypothetical protein
MRQKGMLDSEMQNATTGGTDLLSFFILHFEFCILQSPAVT